MAECKRGDPPERGALDDDFDGAWKSSVAASEGIVDFYSLIRLVQVQFGDELIVVAFLELPWGRTRGAEYACCGRVCFSG